MKIKLMAVLFSVFAISYGHAEQSAFSDALWIKGGHRGQIQALALSPDESLIASGGDATIKIWKFNEPVLIKTLSATGGSASSLVFSSNGQQLVAAHADHAIRIWRISDGSVDKVWSAGAAINSIALSADDSLVAVASGTYGYPSPFDGAVAIRRTADGSLQQLLTNNVADVSSVAFSPDGQFVAAACINEALFVWRVADGSLVWSDPGSIGGWSGEVAFSPDSQTLAHGCGDGYSSVRLRRVQDGSVLWAQVASHSGSLYGLTFSRDGKLLVSVGSRDNYNAGAETNYPSIIMWDPSDGSRIGIVPTESSQVRRVILPRQGSTLLTCEGFNLGINTTSIRLWQTNGTLDGQWTGHSGSVTAVTVSPDGGLVATGDSCERCVKLWRGSDGTLVRTLRDRNAGAVRTIAFSPDGTTVAFGDDWSSSYVGLFRVSDGQLLWRGTAYPDVFSHLAFSRTGSMLATGEGRLIRLRNVTDGKVAQTITNSDTVAAITFAPGDQELIISTHDGNIQFCGTNGVVSRRLHLLYWGIENGDFSIDGSMLAFAFGNSVIVAGTKDGKIRSPLQGHVNPVLNACFSYDGQTIYSVSSDELCVWRVADGKLLQRYANEILSSGALAASPKGNCLVYGRTDATLVVERRPDFLSLEQSRPGNHIQLGFVGSIGTSYLIETSQDLRIWATWTNSECVKSPVSLIDNDPSQCNRFYRLRRK